MSRLVGDRAARLIERQVQMFQAQQRAARELDEPGAVAEVRGIEPGPFITISRQYGAHGSEIAGRLAETLGWTLYDRQLLEAIADDAHLQQRLIEPFDEHERGQMDDLIRGLLTDETVSEQHYTKSLFRVLSSLGQVGRMVVVGRGAHLLLPAERGLRVIVQAPLADRVRHCVAREGMSEAEARHHLERVERTRQNWLRRSYGQKALEPISYDLCLNAATLGVDGCVQTALEALRHKVGEAALSVSA